MLIFKQGKYLVLLSIVNFFPFNLCFYILMIQKTFFDVAFLPNILLILFINSKVKRSKEAKFIPVFGGYVVLKKFRILSSKTKVGCF